MALGREAGGLPRLGLQVADVDQPRGVGQGIGQLGDEQVGHHRGEGRAGAEQDQVGLTDGADRGRHRRRPARLQPDRLDPAAGRGDRHLPSTARPSTRPHSRTATSVAGRTCPRTRSQRDASSSASWNPLEVGEGGQGQVAQVVAGQVAALEPVAEQLADLGGRVGQGEHGLAQVAGRSRLQVAAEPPWRSRQSSATVTIAVGSSPSSRR